MRMALDPIIATGRFAAARIPAPAAMASTDAEGVRTGAINSPTLSVAGATATSSGRSRCPGPMGSVIAIRTASATVSAIDPTCSLRLALVIGAKSW